MVEIVYNSDSIFIKKLGTDNTRIELSLFDITGNLLITKEFTFEIELDIKSLIKGRYLFFFTDGVRHTAKYFHI
jgi:hypothetical protein